MDDVCRWAIGSTAGARVTVGASEGVAARATAEVDAGGLAIEGELVSTMLGEALDGGTSVAEAGRLGGGVETPKVPGATSVGAGVSVGVPVGVRAGVGRAVGVAVDVGVGVGREVGVAVVVGV